MDIVHVLICDVMMYIHVSYTCMCICMKVYIPYSGYFSGGKSFMVFVVERRTTKLFIHKTVPHSIGVWFSVPRPRKFFHELAKNSLLTKILPPEKYPLYGSTYFYMNIHVHVCRWILQYMFLHVHTPAWLWSPLWH